jgi:SAM-dependent methyltransferase
VATSYERGRPEYAPAAVGALAAELELTPGARVLDLGAGTGKLTRALLAWGLDVVAVEPLAPLRDVLAGAVGAQRVLEGRAEAIPLPDSCVAAVTVADAFHWFDAPAALAEIARVLVPGGGLAVIATVPDLGNVPWGDELGALVAATRPEHPHFDGPSWQDAVREAGGWGAPREIRVSSPQVIEAARMVDWLASFSWIAAMERSRREQTLKRGAELFARGPSRVEISVQAVIGLASPA